MLILKADGLQEQKTTPGGAAPLGKEQEAEAADKSAAAVRCHCVNVDEYLWGQFAAPCRICATTN